MSPEGRTHNRYRLPYDVARAAEILAADSPLEAMCGLCGASFAGPTGEALEWQRSHRKAEHPKARDRGQDVRRRAAKAAGRWGA